MSENLLMQSLPNGTQLGPYMLLRLIARGGMGEVYEAYESQLQRRVALKIVAPNDPDEHDRDELVQRFLQEARTLARVNHPNVVTIYAIDNVSGLPFIAMEIVDGVTFKELLQDFIFSADSAAPLFEQMLEGLKCLHDNRIIHRDLKPHNLVLRPDGQVKILDFGIAKQAGTSGEHTRHGVVVGTIPYMPPEVKAGVVASPRSDIWSLGAIFYECLTGRRLHKTLTDFPAGGEVIFSEEEKAKIPAEMRAIILKMTAVRQLDRFENAAEVLTELRQFRQHRPPLPAAVWSTLSKKIEALIDAKRKKQNQSSVSLSGADPFRNPAMNNSAMPLTELPSESGARSHKSRRTKTNASSAERWLWPSVAIAAVLIAAWTYLSSRRAPRVIAGTPTPAEVSRGTPGVDSGSVHLTEPLDQQLVWLEPTRIPTFSWSRVVDPNRFQIQIALDPTFRKILIDEPVSGSAYRPGRILEDGTYYWRLKPMKSAGATVGPQSFTVSLLEPVELVEPDPNHIFEIPAREKAANVRFDWKCKPSARQYRLQIGADGEFKTTLLFDGAVSGCTKSVALPAGHFYWRVRFEDVPQAQDYWSNPLELSLRSRGTPRPVGLAVPKISNPRLQFVLGFRTRPRDLASISEALARPPVLEWSGVRGARNYLVQISPTKDFSKLLSEESTSSTSLAWKNPVPGHVYWRVQARGAASLESSPFSSRGELNILLPAPRLEAAYKLKADPSQDESPIFEWPASALADHYLVQFSTQRNLASSEEQVTREPRLALNTSTKRYFVRVAAATSEGQPISAYSDVAQVEIQARAALPAPTPMTPPMDAKAPSTGGRLSVVFSWSPISGADSYALEIANDPDFKNVFLRHIAKKRGFLLKRAPLSGEIYWRVRSRNAQGTSEWSPTFHFTVK